MCTATSRARTVVVQVKRIIKAKLAQLEDHPADGSKKEFHLNKARPAKTGFSL